MGTNNYKQIAEMLCDAMGCSQRGMAFCSALLEAAVLNRADDDDHRRRLQAIRDGKLTCEEDTGS